MLMFVFNALTSKQCVFYCMSTNQEFTSMVTIFDEARARDTELASLNLC